MKNKLDIVRYGSPCFTYLVSFAIFTDILVYICTDIVSLLSFITVSALVIFLLLYLADSRMLYDNERKLIKFLPIISLLSSVIYEVIKIQAVFRHSSDFSSTNQGLYVLALIIVLIAAICAFFGSYTVLKVSNIIFFIPCIVFILVIVSASVGGLNFELYGDYSIDFISSVFRGSICALIFCLDVYIIIFMQKREKCYSRKEVQTALVVSLILVTASASVFRWMFGAVLLQRIEVPFISAVGVIPWFSFDEIMMFAVSVSILYRLICKMCFCTILLKDIFCTEENVARLFTLLIFVSVAAVGTAMYIFEIDNYIIVFLTLITNLLSFLLFPLLFKKIRK